MNKSYTLYLHTNLFNNKKYVGITSLNPLQRWKNGLGYKKNEYFYRAIQKYGWGNFKHEILEQNLTLEQANQKEKDLIALLKSNNPYYGYNIQEGGNHAPQTDETKEKIRQKALQWSDETKLKMSQAAKRRVERDGAPFLGKHLSEEAKEKLRKIDRSYMKTSEYHEAMSKATSGGKNGFAKKVKATSPEGEVLHFDYKQGAMNFLNLSRSSQKFLNKAIKNHTLYHGYYWEEEVK